MPLKIRRRDFANTNPLTQLPSKLAQIFASRGITSEADLQYSASGLHHFTALKGMQQAVDVLFHAQKNNKQIVIIGDFDADGATSTVVLLNGLNDMGVTKVNFLVPNRFDFGYGLSPEIVDIAADEGAELIITVDNGISSHSGVERAKQLGLQVIITDHHLPGETLPEADAIVNPNLSDCGFPSKNLAGVGVAFYFLLAYRAFLQSQSWFEANNIAKPNVAELLDLVALGTVADVVQLDSNNRILVYQGLQRIRSGRSRPGIQAILEVANRSPERLVASDLGFAVAPRLNAAGRLDDMTIGVQCLLAKDKATARKMAFQLDHLNQERRQVESDMQQDAETLLAEMEFEGEVPAGLALYQPHWHQGVVGILAGRVKDKVFRPTIAFAEQDDNTIKGSARSIPGLHIRDLLEELNKRYPGLIIKFGGHAAAAGLSIAKSDFEQFTIVFAALCDEWLRPEDRANEYVTDGELTPNELSLEFAGLLRQSGPWGQGFPEPSFDGVFTLVEQRIVGNKHLKMQVKSDSGLLLDAIAFNINLKQWPNFQAKQAQLVYRLDVNEFRGKQSVQLLIEAMEAV